MKSIEFTQPPRDFFTDWHSGLRYLIAMLTFDIDGKKVTDYTSFVSEMNQNFISKIEGNVGWNGNLDAFNDYLSWPDTEFCVRIRNSDSVKQVLSKELKNNRNVWEILIEIFKDNSDWAKLELH